MRIAASSRALARFALVWLLLAPALLARAGDEAGPAIVVTPGASQTFRAAVQRFADRGSIPSAGAPAPVPPAAPDPGRADRFREALVAALEFSSVMQVLDTAAYLGPVVTPPGDAAPRCADWTPIGADALVQGTIATERGRFVAEYRVWDTARCQRLAARRVARAGERSVEAVARRVADEIIEAFVGLPGVSSTEISFISTRSGESEVVVMNADGSGQRAATSNRSINKFPSWAPDGTAIVYTSYRYRDRPWVYLSSRGGRQPGPLLRALGNGFTPYRAVFAPDGEKLAFVMSSERPSEIYTARPDGSRLRRLTKNRSVDISPAWSPDGSRLAFVSDRSGSPQIYLMDADGDGVKRLTFQGTYNTSPAWSPDGRWIAYETRLEGQFDIWLIDPEGRVNVPIVTHPRSDESPSWAPNSRKIAFSSTRRGRADLYVIDADGDNLRRLTRDAGNNTSPSWGPFLR